MPPALNLTGNRYGFLTVMYRTEDKYRGKYKWHCVCDCSGEVDAIGSSLVSGNTQSCGCKRWDTLFEIKTVNLVGTKHGRLTVIDITENRCGGNVVWFCKCDCGKTVEVSGDSLVSGNTKSCGCYHDQCCRERATKHGMCGTKEYVRARARKRIEMEVVGKSNWGITLEKYSSEYFCSCVLCGMSSEDHELMYGQSLHIDHVNPLRNKYGAPNGLMVGNAVRLCRTCNLRKSNKSLDELPSEIRSRLLFCALSFKTWEDKSDNKTGFCFTSYR